MIKMFTTNWRPIAGEAGPPPWWWPSSPWPSASPSWSATSSSSVSHFPFSSYISPYAFSHFPLFFLIFHLQQHRFLLKLPPGGNGNHVCVELRPQNHISTQVFFPHFSAGKYDKYEVCFRAGTFLPPPSPSLSPSTKHDNHSLQERRSRETQVTDNAMFIRPLF